MNPSDNEEYLIKVGELSLKGGNRAFFERHLRQNLRRKLQPYRCSVTGRQGRYFLHAEGANAEEIEGILSRTFGIVGFARVRKTEKDMAAITEIAIEMASARVACFSEGDNGGDDTTPLRFKIEARRSDKSFCHTSYEIACLLGDSIRSRIKNVTVDVRHPQWTLNVEIRDRAYVYGPTFRGPGGLPVGTAGKGLLLLSGGIDSPVAGYMMAKRGLRIEAVYFHTFPYTSDQAKEKVVALAEILARYTGPIDLWIVPFTETQLAINRASRPAEVTLLMRSCMLRIAHSIAERRGAVCLVTGESLSQVASQTPESIRLTNSFTDFPVMRPLVGLDKEEIIRRAREIGTFETSILPYDDCCTLFSPKHPLIRPHFQTLRDHFAELDIEGQLAAAADSAELIPCKERL